MSWGDAGLDFALEQALREQQGPTPGRAFLSEFLLGLAPGAGVADAAGGFPNMHEGGTHAGWRENLAQGNYGMAGMQGLGTVGDYLTLLGPAGAAAGVVARAPGAAVRGGNAARWALTSKQEAAMDSPAKAAQRREMAQGALGRPVTYDPPDSRIWLMDRQPIRDALEGHPGVLQEALPRADPGPRVARGAANRPFASQENVGLIEQQIARGRGASGEEWYPSTYPIRQWMDAESPIPFEDFVWANAITSPQSPVPVNMPTATAIMTLQARGLPINRRNMQALHQEMQAKYGQDVPNWFAPEDRLRQYQEYLDTGRPPAGFDDAQKITSYGQSLRGNLQGIPLDTHELAGTSLGSRLYPYWRGEGSVNTQLYGTYEDQYRRVIEEMGLPPASGQASRWIGGGELTGLRTAPGTFLDLSEQVARHNVRRKGHPDSRKSAQDQLFNALRGEEPLVPVYSRKQLLDLDPNLFR